MFPEILSETLAQLRQFAPEDGWNLPTPPAIGATLSDWRIFYARLHCLTAEAEDAMERIQFAAKRNQNP